MFDVLKCWVKGLVKAGVTFFGQASVRHADCSERPEFVSTTKFESLQMIKILKILFFCLVKKLDNKIYCLNKN